MTKLKIKVEVTIIAEVPDDFFPKKVTAEDVHHVAHSMCVHSLTVMPCPAYGPATLDDKGDWSVDVAAVIHMDELGNVDMEIPMNTPQGLALMPTDQVH